MEMKTYRTLSIGCLLAAALTAGGVNSTAMAGGQCACATSSEPGVAGRLNQRSGTPAIITAKSRPPLAHKGVRVDYRAVANFRFNRSRLSANGKTAINNALQQLRTLDSGYGMGREGYGLGVDAIGHTDHIGSHRYNDRLGMRRANTAKRHIVRQGVNAGLVNTQSMGERHPAANNSTSAGRAQNRRTEVIVRTIRAQ